ncbi:MAG: UxaA family hydrolase [Opitutaceae bacterium]
MSSPIPFQACARLAGPRDNVAIATCTIDAGSRVLMPNGERTVPFTVLLGHRFAVSSVGAGEDLLSWGRPFGKAIRPIVAGEYVCNEEILRALSVRKAGGVFPETPNFVSRIVAYRLDESTFCPAPPVEQVDSPAAFLAHQRTGRRGSGTRNFVVLLGTSSRTGSFVRKLAARVAGLARIHPSIDGIVPVAHTEGGDPEMPNNREEVLRTLAGFMVHPNVGAVLAVDYGVEPINNRELRNWMERHDYPLDHTLHRFLSLEGSHAAAETEAEAQIRRWLPAVAASPRIPVDLSGLCIGLQCGGSDAFSGISGNPLVGAVGHEIIRHGGRVCLTETDELIGAEDHILGRVRDLDTARRFLAAIERFKERLSWHGATAEGNPSGGNQLRGLYNITLKSLGASAKKSPLTRLDRVGDYAERILEPGFTFMDGPGSDLEGIAGQVAAGCNLLLFVTGNGSVTNFPFVPTIKVTTTTARHQLLEREMDVNAGRYLDGEPMDRLRDEAFDLVRTVASGERTKGERAGHSQVMIWRNWRQTKPAQGPDTSERIEPDGRPITRSATDSNDEGIGLPALRVGNRRALDRIGLILPVSMCSAEIARLAAERLNAGDLAGSAGLSRFVALVHTEGCGSTGVALYRQLARTYRGYLTHPHVAAALVLEHGCEKIPNDVLRKSLRDSGIDENRFGWASVQLDGGMDKVLDRIEVWFSQKLRSMEQPEGRLADPGALALGVLSDGEPSPRLVEAFGRLSDRLLRSGGSVLVPVSDPILKDPSFRAQVLQGEPIRPTLAYGQPMAHPGLHLVDTETRHWVENLTGLGACGAEILLGAVAVHPREGHPLLPVLQVAAGSWDGRLTAESVDLVLPSEEKEADTALIDLLRSTASGSLQPRSQQSGMTDFQITRGRLGVTS